MLSVTVKGLFKVEDPTHVRELGLDWLQLISVPASGLAVGRLRLVVDSRAQSAPTVLSPNTPICQGSAGPGGFQQAGTRGVEAWGGMCGKAPTLQGIRNEKCGN